MKTTNCFKVILFIATVMIFSGCREEDHRMAFPKSEIVTRAIPKWGNWTKWSDPVLRGQYPLVGDPSVIRDGYILRMFYTCYDPDKKGPNICQATSTDGFTWVNLDTVETKVKGRVLKTGTGRWEDTHETSFVIKNGGQFFLYYSGYVDKGGSLNSYPANLGLSVSSDGVNFRPYSSEPVMRTTPGGYDNDSIFSPSIVKHDGVMYMVYAGHCWRNCKNEPGINLLGATSRDGINWTKREKPILEGAQMPAFFRKPGAGEPELVKGPDGLFYLFYTALQGDNPHVIGLGSSKNPFGPWKMSEEPIIIPQEGRFDEAEIVAPSVLIENGKIRMWFSGFSRKPTIAVGYAEADWPLK